MKIYWAIFRRDLMLIKMNLCKRMEILFALTLLISLLTALQGQKWVLTDSLTGIESAVFRENPLSFPAGWILISLSAVLVSFDFVREDFYEYSSNILVRVGKRYFWLSKIFTGTLLSILLVLLYGIVFAVTDFLFVSLHGEGLMDFALQCSVYPYLFCSMFLGYCLFQLIALFFRQAAGVIIVLVCFTLGMTSNSYWYPINHLMAIRSLELNPLGVSTLAENLLFIGAVTVTVIFAGFLAIDRIDVFSRKENV